MNGPFKTPDAAACTLASLARIVEASSLGRDHRRDAVAAIEAVAAALGAPRG